MTEIRTINWPTEDDLDTRNQPDAWVSICVEPPELDGTLTIRTFRGNGTTFWRTGVNIIEVGRTYGGVVGHSALEALMSLEDEILKVAACWSAESCQWDFSGAEEIDDELLSGRLEDDVTYYEETGDWLRGEGWEQVCSSLKVSAEHGDSDKGFDEIVLRLEQVAALNGRTLGDAREHLADLYEDYAKRRTSP